MSKETTSQRKYPKQLLLKASAEKLLEICKQFFDSRNERQGVKKEETNITMTQLDVDASFEMCNRGTNASSNSANDLKKEGKPKRKRKRKRKDKSKSRSRSRSKSRSKSKSKSKSKSMSMERSEPKNEKKRLEKELKEFHQIGSFMIVILLAHSADDESSLKALKEESKEWSPSDVLPIHTSLFQRVIDAQLEEDFRKQMKTKKQKLYAKVTRVMDEQRKELTTFPFIPAELLLDPTDESKFNCTLIFNFLWDICGFVDFYFGKGQKDCSHIVQGMNKVLKHLFRKFAAFDAYQKILPDFSKRSSNLPLCGALNQRAPEALDLFRKFRTKFIDMNKRRLKVSEAQGNKQLGTMNVRECNAFLQLVGIMNCFFCYGNKELLETDSNLSRLHAFCVAKMALMNFTIANGHRNWNTGIRLAFDLVIELCVCVCVCG